MAKIKITFNEDHIKLIRSLYLTKFTDDLCGFDKYSLYGGTYLYEDMARILDKWDKHIVGTEEDPDGVKFDDETLNYFNQLDVFIQENLDNIEEILHQYCTEGIKIGVEYTCSDRSHIWTYD